eukprot:3940844-Rhodomonas_salina.7
MAFQTVSLNFPGSGRAVLRFKLGLLLHMGRGRVRCSGEIMIREDQSPQYGSTLAERQARKCILQCKTPGLPQSSRRQITPLLAYACPPPVHRWCSSSE